MADFYENLKSEWGFYGHPWTITSAFFFPFSRLDITSWDAKLCKQKQMAPSSWATTSLLFFLSIASVSVSRKQLLNILPCRRKKVIIMKATFLVLHAAVTCFQRGSTVGDVPQMLQLFPATDWCPSGMYLEPNHPLWHFETAKTKSSHIIYLPQQQKQGNMLFRQAVESACVTLSEELFLLFLLEEHLHTLRFND